ncbi:MAG: tetratricopeptide repeat protein [Chthoniobacterales bacterium]
MRIFKLLAVWLERLTPWAETLARVWKRYWLLIISSLLIVGSVILKWVQFPFSHNLNGLKLSLLHDSGINPHLTLISVGVLGILTLGIGLVLSLKYPSALGLAAAVLIMLWAITPAQLAFRQPSVLRRLTYELEVMPLLNAFSKNYLVQNYGPAELIPKRLALYSAWGRFFAAWSFLRLGWYCFGAGSLSLVIYAITQMPSGRLVRTLVLLSLPVGALLVLLIPPAIGQRYHTSGILAAAEGRNQEAIDDFKKAMRWDSWHSHSPDLYATVGQLEKEAGVSFDSPERHISRAAELRAANQYEGAIFELSRAAEAGGAAGETARREIAETRMALGLALYREAGIGPAVGNWEQAIAEDPSFIYVLPYLTRGYYDLGRYQAGIDTAAQLAKLIRDHNSVLANVYSMTADCYAKLGEDITARRYYSLSITTDPVLNYWALTGLAGE